MEVLLHNCLWPQAGYDGSLRWLGIYQAMEVAVTMHLTVRINWYYTFCEIFTHGTQNVWGWVNFVWTIGATEDFSWQRSLALSMFHNTIKYAATGILGKSWCQECIIARKHRNQCLCILIEPKRRAAVRGNMTQFGVLLINPQKWHQKCVVAAQAGMWYGNFMKCSRTSHLVVRA